MSEAELAKIVISWLEASGWDVYQEVQALEMGSIADWCLGHWMEMLG